MTAWKQLRISSLSRDGCRHNRHRRKSPSPVLLGRFSKDLDDMVLLERGAKTFGVTTLSIIDQIEAIEILQLC